jgi:hypothetical protein
MMRSGSKETTMNCSPGGEVSLDADKRKQESSRRNAELARSQLHYYKAIAKLSVGELGVEECKLQEQREIGARHLEDVRRNTEKVLGA